MFVRFKNVRRKRPYLVFCCCYFIEIDVNYVLVQRIYTIITRTNRVLYDAQYIVIIFSEDNICQPYVYRYCNTRILFRSTVAIKYSNDSKERRLEIGIK